MRVASLVLGIIAVVFSFIPCVCIVSPAPAAIGLLLGIFGCIQAAKKQQPKGMGIAGVILNIIALVVSILMIQATDHAVDKLKEGAEERKAARAERREAFRESMRKAGDEAINRAAANFEGELNRAAAEMEGELNRAAAEMERELNRAASEMEQSSPSFD